MEKHRLVWERPAEDLSSNQLRERFRKVILSRGYSPEAAESIIAEWFAPYMENVSECVEMLREYEERHKANWEA